MWKWRLNWDEIRDDLVIGACPMTTADIDSIHEKTGATALFSLQTDECRAAFGIDYTEHRDHGKRKGLVLINAPMRDFDPPEQRRRLPRAVASLHKVLDSRHKVYVYCTAGINRSPLTVLGYLTFIEGMSKDAAFGLILGGRPQAEPYWEAYDGCHLDLLDKYREAIKSRAFQVGLLHPENNQEQNWREAEKYVIRAALLGTLPEPPNNQNTGQDSDRT